MFRKLLNSSVSFDRKLMLILNRKIENPLFDRIMPLFHEDSTGRKTMLGILFSVFFLGGKKGRLASTGSLMLVLVTEFLSSYLIKPVASRSRPCIKMKGLRVFRAGKWYISPDPEINGYQTGTLSFPSAHAANTSAQVLWWSHFYPGIRWILRLLGTVIGYSRIYNGMHYPVDVSFGWGIGTSCYLFVKRHLNKIKRLVKAD